MGRWVPPFPPPLATQVSHYCLVLPSPDPPSGALSFLFGPLGIRPKSQNVLMNNGATLADKVSLGVWWHIPVGMSHACNTFIRVRGYVFGGRFCHSFLRLDSCFCVFSFSGKRQRQLPSSANTPISLFCVSFQNPFFPTHLYYTELFWRHEISRLALGAKYGENNQEQRLALRHLPKITGKAAFTKIERRSLCIAKWLLSAKFVETRRSCQFSWQTKNGDCIPDHKMAKGLLAVFELSKARI